ncbi:MAG: 1,5-anhydro-D-fructose reductase [Chloroflexi bacterium ADurb.Bin325]|nr:MAG: 1,5-anhydro-D-fructose reductase [Chloroflexi bacterium ADurb.Bin325]
MSTPIRWGILSTGRIANLFARGLAELPDAQLVAVGSRTQAAADEFADKYNIPHRHASYEALANDPDVDIIYVATPHSLHCAGTLLCLNAGKAVICEKPFAINAAETREMIATARAKRLFLMEAMWSRFLPSIVRVRELIAEGAIGEVRMVEADFGFRAEINPAGRLFNPELGGGGLLDVGIYVNSLASMILGKPERIVSAAHLGETGVDEQAAMVYGYAGGALALLSCAVRTNTLQEATIYGAHGSIRIHSPWWRSEGLTLQRAGHEPETLALPMQGNGYNYEAAEAMACLRAGKLESAVMPLDETLAIMETLDTLREQWGLRYPME